MLPTHRPNPATESLSRLSKGSNPFSKFITRWVILICSVVVLLWLARPLFGDMLWDASVFQFYPPVPPPHVRPIRLPPPPTPEEQQVWESRKIEVRDAFKHAWGGYRFRAFPHDELRAVTGDYSDK